MAKCDGFVEGILGTPLSDEEMKARMQEAADKNKEYNIELRKRAKPKEELFIPVDCLVEKVMGYTHGISHTPHSEMRFGGDSPSYRTGRVYPLELSVQTGTPVRTINFPGWPPIEAGDKIRAYIFAGKQEEEKWEGTDMARLDFNKTIPIHWVQREFTEKEEAQKIEKLRNKEVVATYINS